MADKIIATTCSDKDGDEHSPPAQSEIEKCLDDFTTKITKDDNAIPSDTLSKENDSLLDEAKAADSAVTTRGYYFKYGTNDVDVEYSRQAQGGWDETSNGVAIELWKDDANTGTGYWFGAEAGEDSKDDRDQKGDQPNA